MTFYPQIIIARAQTRIRGERLIYVQLSAFQIFNILSNDWHVIISESRQARRFRDVFEH